MKRLLGLLFISIANCFMFQNCLFQTRIIMWADFYKYLVNSLLSIITSQQNKQNDNTNMLRSSFACMTRITFCHFSFIHYAAVTNLLMKRNLKLFPACGIDMCWKEVWFIMGSLFLFLFFIDLTSHLTWRSHSNTFVHSESKKQAGWRLHRIVNDRTRILVEIFISKYNVI